MKKIFIVIILGTTITLSGMNGFISTEITPSVSANDLYPNHLWGDSNYELIYGNMDVGRYIDWSSYTLIQDSGKGPGQTIFAVNVLSVDMRRNTVTGTSTYEFVIDHKKGHFCRIDKGEWNRFDPNEEYGYNAVIVRTYNACMQSLYN